MGALVATGCGVAPTGPAAGSFSPSEPGVLMVAASLPAPGFWEGTAAAPTGGFEHGLALELAERFGLDEVRVVDVPFDRLVTGDTCAVPEHITAVVVGRTGADGIETVAVPEVVTARLAALGLSARPTV